MADGKIKELCATRTGKLGVCTCKMNELKELLKGGDIEAVDTGIEQLHVALDEFKDVHQSVQVLHEEEEKKSDNDDWYQPKMQTFETFLNEVEMWKSAQSHEPQTVVSPLDSISIVAARASKVKSPCSSDGVSSKSSSVSSARLIAEAEKAALLQRAEGMKKKQALEMERIKVQNAMERVELETELAAANAKVQVLQSIDAESMN